MHMLGILSNKEAKIGIIGLGYVGLPLVSEFCRAGFKVIGFDNDAGKVSKLLAGESYIKHIDLSKIPNYKSSFLPTTDFSKLSETDCIIICVPTPLNKNREPNLSYVTNTAKTISQYLRKGHLVVLESTTYPGTTDEEIKVILEETGLRAGEDFNLAYSPEREDPNNKDFSTATIPKVVGGYSKDCLKMAQALYDNIVDTTIPVSSTKVAEASKLLENIYRSVNIALVNELKILFDRMGIDVWEVIEAAATKPFGFHPFYPGPGLGGHCVPIDPFYLTWKAREFDFSTRFIELAGEINTSMPYYVVEKVGGVLSKHGKSLNNSNILVLGIAYKKDVDDQRESPSLKIIELLKKHGAEVTYNDPFVPESQGQRNYPGVSLKSEKLTENTLKNADLILLVTNHTSYDYAFIEKHAQCIVDTRGVFRKNNIVSPKVHNA